MKASLKLIALGIACMGLASTAQAAITLTNAEGTFTPWTGLDYASENSAAWTEGFGAAFAQVTGGGGSATFTIRFAGMTTALTGSSALADITGLDSSANGTFKSGANVYEYTTVGTFSATLVSCIPGGAECDFNITGGTFDVYYDQKGSGLGSNAKTGAGTQWKGFDDGVKIISGNLSNVGGLDATFNDTSGGAVSLAGSIGYTNSSYISPDLSGSNITSTLQLGAGLTSFNGPLTSLLRADNTVLSVGANELVFQADGNHTFTTAVPEPASLLLAGLALAAVGGTASRRRSVK